MIMTGELSEASPTSSGIAYNVTTTSSNSSKDVTRVNDVTMIVRDHVRDVLLWFVLDLTLTVFIVMGSGLTLAAVWRSHALQTQANMYVVSLAIADIVGGLYLAMDAAWILPVTGSKFDKNNNLCLLREGILYLWLSVSMVTVVSMAMDKLLFVATPFWHRRIMTSEKTLVVIFVSWVLSVLYGSVAFHVSEFDVTVGCQQSNVLDADFIFFGCTTPVAVAIVIVAGCYIQIVRIVLKQRRKIQAVSHITSCDLDRDSYRKSLKLFLAVLGAFVACWAPFAIQGFVFYTFREFYHDTCVYRAFLYLALFSSGLNFFLYAWKNKEFRAAYKRLLLDCCYTKPQ